MRTLIFEPDAPAADADALKQVLRAHGGAVARLSDLDEAWAHARDEQPDLIVLVPADDQAMELCQRVRADEALALTVILAVVPFDAQDRLERLVACGIDDYVVSPLAAARLDARVAFAAQLARSKTDRASTAQALRESEAKARAILDTTVDAVITIDDRGRIDSFNKAAERIFGYAADEVIGENVDLLMPSPYREEHDGYLASYRDTGRRRIIGIGREVVGLRKDGSTFPMDLAVSEVPLDGRRLFTGIVRDISERRELEQQLLQISEQERRRIGQDLHDGLGQMLTGIGLIAQNLARRLEPTAPETAAEVAELADLVKDADQTARRLSRGLVPVDLDKGGLRTALGRLAMNAERLFGITCTFEHVGEADIDDNTVATHLYRIAQEAVSNGAQHGRAEQVAIQLAVGGEQTRLRVQDDGHGFGVPAPAPHLPPRTRKQTDKSNRGMGIRIMHHRARIIGGTLEIRPNPDGGTTVTCTLNHRSGGWAAAAAQSSSLG